METVIKNKKIYWALISTFIALYAAVAFVSTLHAITFFQLANTLGLAILLGAAYEIGQAAVLFSILMTENKNRTLAWGMMFLLTALQVTANVYASFKFMDNSGSTDWTYWQRAILIGVEADSPETYKIIISWISGALLPLVALGMTALVAENIRLARGEDLSKPDDEDESKPVNEDPGSGWIREEKVNEIVDNEVKRKIEENDDTNKAPIIGDLDKKGTDDIFEIESADNNSPEEEKAYLANAKKQLPAFVKKTKAIFNDPDSLVNGGPGIGKGPKKIMPSNKIRGWHLMNEYIDDENNVFSKGDFIENNPVKKPTSKKA